MTHKVDRVAFAGEDNLGVACLPGAGLRFAHDGEIGFSSGAKLENHIAGGRAVGAFEAAAAATSDSAEAKPYEDRKQSQTDMLFHDVCPFEIVSDHAPASQEKPVSEHASRVGWQSPRGMTVGTLDKQNGPLDRKS